MTQKPDNLQAFPNMIEGRNPTITNAYYFYIQADINDLNRHVSLLERLNWVWMLVRYCATINRRKS